MSNALVWFKRDLRIADHAPLAEAARCDAALALFIIEPAWLASPECHARHVSWLLLALAPLSDALSARGLSLLVRSGEAVTVLSAMQREFAFTHLFSHEETGPGWSYERDQAVARWCRTNAVTWTEWPQTGVVRRLKDRRGWAGRWQKRMDAPLIVVPQAFAAAPGFAPSALPQALPTPRDLGVQAAVDLPAAGEAAGQRLLDSFLSERALGYRRNLSSPLTAQTGCSRLSEHLAFGTLSMRAVHQRTEAAISSPTSHTRSSTGSNTRSNTPDRELAYGLRGFAGRLRWHCHFMQKLEDEPAIEWRNFARTADGLRPGDGRDLQPEDRERLQAWCEGRTGFPMVDACMRQLVATGWLNFRMRAMLVSFAAYHLWLHWREPGLFLARQFLDFEPGIHWSQMQMQSGTTGINTLRIYSPTKQALDQDPQGLYVRQWIPEYGTTAYPQPIVDERSAVAFAKQQLYGLRQTSQAHDEASAIQHKHGSRKSGLPPSGPRAGQGTVKRADTATRTRTRPKPPPDDDAQGSLF